MFAPQAANERERALLAAARVTGQVWVLERDGGWANFTDEGATVIPIWPGRDEAQRCAEVSFPGYQPRMLPWAEFTEDILPRLAERDVWVAINPANDLAGNYFPARRWAEGLSPGGA